METILCRLPNYLGDTCMCLPALQLLAASGYTPSLVGRSWAGDLLAGLGWRFDPIEGKLFNDISRVRSIRRETGIRRGILFPNSLNSALLFRMGLIDPAGFTTDGRSLLLSTRIPEPKKEHEVKRFFDLVYGVLHAWGTEPVLDTPRKTIRLPLLKRHEAGANNIIKKYALPRRFALLAPLADGVHHGKRKEWPHFAEIIEPLKKDGITPIIFPAPGSFDKAKELFPGAMVLPPITLGVYAAMAKRAVVVVANDSGISHLASVVGANQITLVGVTDPSRTSPWSPNAHVLGKEGEWASTDEVLACLHQFAS